MSVNLVEHIHEMTNGELNSVAKLRFTDKETQIELANNSYLLCRKYLAANPRLCTDARDILLAGRADSVKLILMSAGHMNEYPEKISELYFRFKTRGYWRFNEWRMSKFFWSWNDRIEAPNTPTNVLRDIYDQLVEHSGQYGTRANRLVSLLQHRNSTERMAVIASTSENETVRRAGFERLVKLRTKKN